jgi:hypothetical protein
MKLKMFALDFEKCTLEFSVPKEIMHTRSFGNVPGGVEVDMVAITGDATLGSSEGVQKQSAAPCNIQSDETLPLCDEVECNEPCIAGPVDSCACIAVRRQRFAHL